MKELNVFLKTVVDGMKVMAQGVESLAEKLDGIAKARLDEKAKTKPARKAQAKPKKKVAKKAVKKAVTKKPVAKKPATVAKTVLKTINRSKKGIGVAALSEKTGFAPNRIHDVVYKLKKEGKVKAVSRGVYLKA